MKRLFRARMLRRMDRIMVFVILLLIGIGIAFIYSSGFAGNDPTVMGFYRKQYLWAALGMICFSVFAATDYHALTKKAWWLYAAGIALLALVLLPEFGHSVYGARRWFQIAGVRLLQPSELMKLAVIIILARIFGWPDKSPRRSSLIVLALILTMLPVVLIARQPDLGTAVIFLPMLGAVMFAAGAPLRALGVLAAIGILICSILVGLVLLPQQAGWSEERQEKAWSLLGVSSYQRERILVFFDSDRDPLGAGWNKAQSQIAIGSGRFRGKGYLQGTQNILGFLPRSVAPTDFVFSVIAEEKGFMGASLLLFLFTVLLGCCVRAAAAARDKEGFILCAGVATMLFCHAFINIAMTIGLLPITGTPLPLVSYGGTFMIGVMSALGIVQSVYIRRHRNNN